MKCPYCQADSHVVDTREVASTIRRRRECDGCRQRFTTYEQLSSTNLQVVKRDRRREGYSQDKLLTSIQIACAKRPISTDVVNDLLRTVESELYRQGRSEIDSQLIGDLVIAQLRLLDDVAYVRFASVYRRFTDLDGLVDEIERLRDQKQRDEEDKRQMRLIEV
ncbi:MAG: transcriptional repressor NrdR [Ardenticatenales bacterium]|jgi:transcriptional repressor NrdR|nr:transcriptional repressor NrdR [Ardenticatenales bacterium]